MIKRTLIVAITAAASVAISSVPAMAAPAHPVLFHLRDPRIDEASGIAVGARSPGVVYVQNDSGDSNRFFAVNARTGATAATVIVRGARNVDWEDIATAPSAAGVPSVWLADIGDNDALRHEVQIYQVAEPRVVAGAPRRTVVVPVAAEWRVRYPGGPTDAESLAVTPDGTAYVATKSLTGMSAVYRVPRRPDPDRVQLLRRVGSISFVPHGTANPFGVAGELTATGAAMSRNGAVFAIRTYAAAYFWRLTGVDLASALRAAPVRMALPRQPQGEGLALDGRRVLLDSEGRHSAVLAVPLPRLPAPAAMSDPRSSGTPSSPDPASSSTRAPKSNHPGSGFSVAAGVVLAVLIAIAVAFALRRRRPPRGDESER